MKRPDQGCHLVGDISQEHTCARDFDIIHSLPPEHHIRRIVKEVICILVSVKITQKHMKMFGKIFTAYVKPQKVDCTTVLLPHLGRQRLQEKSYGRIQRFYQK